MRKPVKCFKDLIVWQKSIDLAEQVYHLTPVLPKTEIYGLLMQMQRAAVSVPSNIAEGQGRRSTRSFIHYLLISRGSLQELETQLILAVRLKLIDRDEVIPTWRLMQEVGKMLNSLIHKLRKKLRANKQGCGTNH
jgi:four helix bundle protein